MIYLWLNVYCLLGGLMVAELSTVYLLCVYWVYLTLTELLTQEYFWLLHGYLTLAELHGLTVAKRSIGLAEQFLTVAELPW